MSLLTATAAAVAVAVAACVCWVVTKQQFSDQLDRSLRQADALPQIVHSIRDNGCVQSAPVQERVFNVAPDQVTTQIVLPSGQACWVQGKETFAVTAEDLEVTTHTSNGGGADVLHTVRSGKEDWRVYTRTTPYVLDGQPVALSVARPMSEVTGPLTTLAWALAVVTATGFLAAGAVGVALTSTGLRPVRELTAAVQYIASSQDLDVRIPVTGNDELASLSRSFNSMTEALASSQELQQQLIADAGHELRTPLTSMRTNIELLVRSEKTGRKIPAEQREALLDSLTAQMEELANLIGDLQELSRAPHDNSSSASQHAALHEIVERAVNRAQLRGPEVSFETQLSPWFVQGDPSALERSVVNLLDNAVKFSPSGAPIHVLLAAGALIIRDHGPGISPDELPHVFDRFWRSPASRSLPGSGLGLSIVAKSVAQIGGTVQLRPAIGDGTEAVVKIPGQPVQPEAGI
ncbi:HAMP domain-containing sensor histidine kinase [Streptomyces clavifer]|uniref:sensor histidine kinase n=1 Tax=Streptomyces clavifer TaxID=68188 RepID=UPI0033BBF7D5